MNEEGEPMRRSGEQLSRLDLGTGKISLRKEHSKKHGPFGHSLIGLIQFVSAYLYDLGPMDVVRSIVKMSKL